MNRYAKYSPGPGLFMLLVGLPGAPKPHAGEDLQPVHALFEWCTRSHTVVFICAQITQPLQTGVLCECTQAVAFNSFNRELQLAGSSHKLSHCMRMQAHQAFDSNMSTTQHACSVGNAPWAVMSVTCDLTALRGQGR